MLAGAGFGLALAVVEPPFALLLGSDPGGWSAGDRLVAGVSASLCAAALAGFKRITSAA